MGFKDLFIKSEESNEKKQEIPTPQVPVPTKPVSTPPVIVESQGSSSISADDTIVNMIWDKIISANRPGPDYLELKNNVEALEDLPISNEQKLISAFKVLKKGYPSFQKEDITKAIDFYINVVNDEKAAGLQQLEELRSKKIDGVEQEIKAMQIRAEELKKQYDELQANIGAKTIELTQAKNEIEVKSKAFIGSIESVMRVLVNDKENIISINF